MRLGRFLAGSIRLEPVAVSGETAAPAAKRPPGAGFGGENICKAEGGGRVSCWNWGTDGTFSPGEYLADGDRPEAPGTPGDSEAGGHLRPDPRFTVTRARGARPRGPSRPTEG